MRTAVGAPPTMPDHSPPRTSLRDRRPYMDVQPGEGERRKKEREREERKREREREEREREREERKRGEGERERGEKERR